MTLVNTRFEPPLLTSMRDGTRSPEEGDGVVKRENYGDFKVIGIGSLRMVDGVRQCLCLREPIPQATR